jgi:hypothetical protein
VDRDALRRHALDDELGLVQLERERPHLLQAGDHEDALAHHDLEALLVADGLRAGPEPGDDERLVRLRDLPGQLHEQDEQQDRDDR